MQALVYHGPGDKRWEEVPDPKLVADTDAVVQITSSTICGTDLHILKGDVATVTPGRVLGHEAVGTVTEVGSGVHSVRPGDRVVLSCISACGRCRYCRIGQYGQCMDDNGGWALGNIADGVQAEAARVPFADNSVYKVPEELSDEQVIYLSDILCTGYEVGVLNGQVQPGDTVVVVGAGPIGLSTILGAKLFAPANIVAVEPTEMRRTWAEQFGATTAVTPDQARATVDELTDGLGADVAIEAVGIPETFELCTELIRPGGHVANIGVHGKPATLHLETLWRTQVTITTGIPHTLVIPQLMRAIQSGTIDPTPFTSHRFPLDQTMEAYDVFTRASETDALKVVLQGS